MNFIAPLAAALAALSIPIVMLYMLRLRRTETQISSNFLWQHLVRDREANAPWQRLRFSWLLLLQLFILALLVLALMRPFMRVETFSSGRIVLLLDASASMNATDVNDNRFEQAKDTALELVGTLGNDDSMTVIRVSEVPEVLISASQDQNALRSAIRGTEVSQASADWVAAMTLAAAGARGVEDLEVVIVSDGGITGNFPEIPGVIRLISIGEHKENLAISALATRNVAGQGPQLFAQITNYGDQETEAILGLRLNGSEEIFSAERYLIPANDRADIIISDLPPDFERLEASLSTPSDSTIPDYLPVDDRAYAVNNTAGSGRVLLVTQRNIFLAQIFSSLPGFRLTQATPEVGIPANNEYDLYVFDGWLPDELPFGDIFIINPPTSVAGYFSRTGEITDINLTHATRIQPDNPLTQYLDFDNVNIRTINEISGFEDWATDLVQADGGSLFFAGEQNGRQLAVLTFALQDSDLPLQLTWPILVSNLSQWYTPPRALDVPESIQPNQPILIRPLVGNNVTITLPNGDQETLELIETPQAAFANTVQAGIYRVEVRQDENLIGTEYFAVNLFDPQESRIQPQESVTIGTTTIAESAREEVGQRELWQYLALLGLLMLLIEWIYYHRTGVRQLTTQLPTFAANRRLGRNRRATR